MWKHLTWAGGCLSVGLVMGSLIASVIDAEPVSPSAESPDFEAAIEPELLVEAIPEANPDEDWIRTEAAALAAGHVRKSDLDSWIGRYTSEDEFLVANDEDSVWVTVTSVRVPCARVDQHLARNLELGPGVARTCRRWLRAAAASMKRHGIRGKTPRQYLQELGSDESVRVMLIYTGWMRDPDQGNRIRLIEAQTAEVYPRNEFVERRNQAQNAIFRRLRLGAYAEIARP